MLRRLAFQGFVEVMPYTSVVLTRKGMVRAITLVRKHRLIEVFLYRVLKVNKKFMHGEAQKLEHAFSDSTIEKLNIFLKAPKVCPDGYPIP